MCRRSLLSALDNTSTVVFGESYPHSQDLSPAYNRVWITIRAHGLQGWIREGEKGPISSSKMKKNCIFNLIFGSVSQKEDKGDKFSNFFSRNVAANPPLRPTISFLRVSVPFCQFDENARSDFFSPELVSGSRPINGRVRVSKICFFNFFDNRCRDCRPFHFCELVSAYLVRQPSAIRLKCNNFIIIMREIDKCGNHFS